MPAVVTCEAVLFDMDGTLVDSTAVVERQWARWAARRRVDLAAVLAISHGRPTLETLSRIAPQWATTEEAAAVEATTAEDDDGLVAVTGARELASALPPSRWAVVTSAGRELAVARLTAAGLPLPAVLVTADDVSPGKPDPGGYLEAARRLSARPERCLIFEDAPVGVRAGIERGSDRHRHDDDLRRPRRMRASSGRLLVGAARRLRTATSSGGAGVPRSAGWPTRASDQARSNRSRFMTLFHAAAKSRTNFSLASSQA